MPNTHPTVKTYEEFCKHYEQESDLGKRRLFETYQVAVKFLEARRKRERNRYAERKVEKVLDRTISIQTEPIVEQEVENEPEFLETIEEEVVVPIKVKRNSLTIPRLNVVELNLRAPSPARQFHPQIISNTKIKRQVKTAPV